MKKFSRCLEDFLCLHCGNVVAGSGYTNHCPRCLWSRDVDINPGDRAGNCGGMMRPTGIEARGDSFSILHKCEKCGKTARCRAAENDDPKAIIQLSQNPEFVFGK